MRPISELITERDMLDFSQGFNVQRNYLGSRLFPDQKTQYIEAEYSRIVENGNLPTVAMIHGFDTEAHIASRVPFERVVTEQLLIKEKINLTERLRFVTRGLDMQMDSVRRYCFDDVARMAESVVARVEKAKMEALSTGKMTINENNVSMEVDFGVPSDQKVATKWAVADADIIGDIDKWVTIANGKGQTPPSQSPPRRCSPLSSATQPCRRRSSASTAPASCRASRRSTTCSRSSSTASR